MSALGAGVRWALHLGALKLGDTVLILGPGQRGLCAVIAAHIGGAGSIIVTGLAKDQFKLQLAREFGAHHTINVEEDNTVERVRDITNGIGADVVLDVTPMASQPVLDALECVRHGGRIVLAGLKGRRPISLVTDALIQKGATMIGAYSVDARAYLDAIRIIESGLVPLEKMHTHTFGLEDAGRAVETLAGEVPGEPAVHVSIAPAGMGDLRYLVDLLGFAQLLIGTDHPAMQREVPVGKTLRHLDLDDRELDDITWNNCFRWLAIEAPKAQPLEAA